MFHLLAAKKDWIYHLGYWGTAILPVLLGLLITVFLIKYLEKSYKGTDEETETDEKKKKDGKN